MNNGYLKEVDLPTLQTLRLSALKTGTERSEENSWKEVK
jgi:hypothetical protein